MAAAAVPFAPAGPDARGHADGLTRAGRGETTMSMSSAIPSTSEGGKTPRRWFPLALVLLVIGDEARAADLVIIGRDRKSYEDCETKPPPTEFAVAACDDGSKPAGEKPAHDAPATPSRP